jgi:NADH-quinone oxidoreductase subunit N
MTWQAVINIIYPELILIVAACVLFLLGVSSKATARKLAPILALLALLIVFWTQVAYDSSDRALQADPAGALRVTDFGRYIKLISAAVGSLFVLLAWPSDREATGNSALQFGPDAGEFFALMLLSICGIFIVASANDIILLFLGIELASIPTYIMVSISRPLPVAQEAGVKYFFLGAMAAALMLFGFSYLYGTTGLIDLSRMTQYFADASPRSGSPTVLTSWQLLAVVVLIAGFSFKMAAVPLHFYAGDVYEGAATPVTSLLSFVPKISGFVALIKILFTISGGTWMAPETITRLLWIVAVLTMSVGNILGLVQRNNVKRLLAYSSIAHSGYMLVGITALLSSREAEALQGVLFYLAAYGIMNVAAFGVLMLLPSRSDKPATSAETFDDIAGAGREHPALGLAMAVACFSLIGLPLTVGFFGKVYLIRPALHAANYWLVIIMMINAAISAGYYLEIVRRMFLAPHVQPLDGYGAAVPVAEESASTGSSARPAPRLAIPLVLAVSLSTAGTLLFGIILPATEVLHTQVIQASNVDERPTRTTATDTATSTALARQP